MWTKQQDAMLLQAWGKLSVAEIAADLRTTRNAVIGRYHRLQRTQFPWKTELQEQRRESRHVRQIAEEKKHQEFLHSFRLALRNGASRNQALKMAHKKGATLQLLGDEVGLSRERIRQIVSNAA